MNDDDVSPVYIPPFEQLEAWEREEVDIVLTYEPFASKLIEKNAHYVLSSRDFPEMIFDVLAVREDRLRGRESSVKKLLDAHFKTLKYFSSNYQDVIHRIATREEISLSDVKRALGGVILPTKIANYGYFGKDSRLIISAKELNKIMSKTSNKSEAVDVVTDNNTEQEQTVENSAAPQQAEMPFAIVQGEQMTQLPQDLYIPPHALEVFLDAFEGPLDLLLYLIRRQNLDVLDIPIAEITIQYMEYVDQMKEIQLELAAEYLVMAAMLAEIKSRMLLPKIINEEGEEEDDSEIEIPDWAKPGPIDVDYKSKMKSSAAYEAPEHTIKTWGRRGTSNGIMGVWGEFVSVDYDICIADGGCLAACPVGVYEWFASPGNPASEQKPLMSKEPDCIFCLACEGVCPPQAIKIYEQK